MKLLNNILLLTAFTGHVAAQNCACYPLQYNFKLDLADLTRACDYTYENGAITDNNDQGPNPIPPGIASLDLPPTGVGNPAAFEYVGCSTSLGSTIPVINPAQILIVEIEEFGPDEFAPALNSYEYGYNGEPALRNGDFISYDSITATDPNAIVKTLKVYMGLREIITDVNGNTVNNDQDFEFEVRYSNLCDAVPYTAGDFAGYLNFVSFHRATCSFLSFFNWYQLTHFLSLNHRTQKYPQILTFVSHLLCHHLFL